MNLREKSIRGVLWTFTQQFSVQIINFSVQIILARLLLPEEFALIAMIQIFLAIGTTLMDGGMTSSLIRTIGADQKDYSTVFFINLFASIAIYMLLFGTAPFIAIFFNQPQLTLIIRIYTLSFIIQALVGVQTTKLTKEMNFKLQMYMQIPSVIVGGISGLIMAYKGYGVWSLVWMHLITTTLFMLQHWFRSDWRPSLIFDLKKFKYHFKFGYKLTFSALLTNIYTNSYTLIIGKFFPPAQLGFYHQANRLRMFPVSNLTSALQKVTYPMFSTLQNDNSTLKSVFKRITLLVFYIVTPIMLLLTLIAEPLFRIILTEKWLPSVPYFQILSISAIVYPLSMYNLNIILAKGRSDLHFKLEVLKKGFSILFLLLIIPYGVYGAVFASGISMIIHAFFNSLISGRLIEYPLIEQIKNITPILLIGSISLLCSYLLYTYLASVVSIGDIICVIIIAVTYMTLYVFLSLFFKVESVKDIIIVIRQAFNKNNN